LFFLIILFRSYGLIKSFLVVVPLTAVERRPVRATRPRPSRHRQRGKRAGGGTPLLHPARQAAAKARQLGEGGAVSGARLRRTTSSTCWRTARSGAGT